MKVKCPKCKKTFKGDDHIKALLECPYWTCGLKEPTINNGVGVGTREGKSKSLVYYIESKGVFYATH